MKKLFVFFSIFAVLFVSTIRPLQAEVIADDFTFVNGETYYFIYDTSNHTPSFTIAIADRYGMECVIDISYDSKFLEIEIGPTNGPYEYPNLPLTFIGNLDTYTDYAGNIIENASVYSFTWTLQTISGLQYDDVYLSFDTENPIPPVSIYDTIYSIINNFVFGNSIESGSHQDLIAILLSSIAVVFVFALPFLLVWKVIKIIMG